MIWMYGFIPALRYRHTDQLVARPFEGSFFRVLLRLAPWASVAFVLVSTLQYAVSLASIYLLATLVERPAEQPFHARMIAGLLVLALGAFALVAIQLNLERILSLRVCHGFENLLNRRHRERIDLPLLERIASRDLSLVLDGIGSGIGLVSVPVFLCGATLAALLQFGSAGFWAVSAIWLFLPLSYLMSRLSDGNYERIMEITARRIELCSAWLRDGPLLKQFRNGGRLAEIEETLATELSRRNLDTVLRGADSYIVGFGRLLPVVLLMVLSGLVSGNAWGGSIFWLSIPLLAAVLSLPRAYLSYRTVSRSLRELNFLATHSEDRLSSAMPLNRPGIDFDRRWPLWPATLGELLPVRELFPDDELAEWLRRFRLIPELGPDFRSVLQRFVDVDGRNLSEGQRLRLQLLRGILLARAQGLTLYVDDDFSSLDGAAAHGVRQLLLSMDDALLSERAEQAIARREIGVEDMPPPLAGDVPAPGVADYSLAKLLGSCFGGILWLLLPALMMSYAANLTLAGSQFSAWQIVLYALLGIVLGTTAGLFIESRLRSRFCSLFLTGLGDLREGDLSDALQVVSRDVTTAFERISWYAHDIAWVLALLVCNVVALWIGFGWPGLAVALAFGVVLLALYHLSIDELSRTRRESVGGFDALMRSTQVAYTLADDGGSAFGGVRAWLDGSRRRAITAGLERFYTTRMCSVVSRTMMAASCSLVSDAVIVLIVLMGGLYRSSDFGFTLAVTALLLVRSDLANVFLAVTGLRSQSLSVSRLSHFARNKARVLATLEHDTVRIAPFGARRDYRSCHLGKGRVHMLSGASGSGKSQYLKGIAGVTEVASRESGGGEEVLRCYYLDRQVLPLMGMGSHGDYGLMGWLRRLPADGRQLILLDELFSLLSVEDLQARLRELERYARWTGNTLVVVDHRHRLAHNIELSELAC
ncbi:ABC transporter ATP-binding protein [Pseudomonas sp. LFM046]|uniref:ABC transporter ATP-binding protein n=1 Tax=Pseudomonas sp. LFM046 TaxID=1608357 RepID=UPI000ADDE1E3|nr:ABC transporter ATP-binding protein [Pseudomonas sp. LFM046]